MVLDRTTARGQNPPMSSDDGAEGVRPNGAATLVEADLADLLTALRAARDGDFSQRLTPQGNGTVGEVADALNALLQRNDEMSRELVRVGKIIGREGRMTERAELSDAGGAWATGVDALNALIDDLVRPPTEVARGIGAVGVRGRAQEMALKIGGARGARGRYRGQARRSGRGPGCVGHVEGPD